jgi:hypothetical protein
MLIWKPQQTQSILIYYPAGWRANIAWSIWVAFKSLVTFSPKSDSYDEPNLSAAAAGRQLWWRRFVLRAPLWLRLYWGFSFARTRFYYVFPLLGARIYRGWLFEWHLTRPKKTASRWYKSAHTKAVGRKMGAAWGANPPGVLSGALSSFLLFAPLFSHAAVSPVWQTHAHEYNVDKQGFLNEVDNGRTRLRSRRFYGLTNFYSGASRECLLTDERRARRKGCHNKVCAWITERRALFVCNFNAP